MEDNPETDNRIEMDAEDVPEVTFTVCIEPDAFEHCVDCPYNSTIASIKQQICEDLRLPIGSLTIHDLDIVCQKQHKKDSQLRFDETEYFSNDKRKYYFKAQIHQQSVNSSEHYTMPDEIEVTVNKEKEEELVHFTVQIIKFDGIKPYLGGYKNKSSQHIYHHASTQTFMTSFKDKRGPSKYHRESQTSKIITRSIQTTRECGTQMERNDIQLNKNNDRVLIPKPYFDSFQHHYLKTKAVLMIQCFYRGYVARCRAIYRRECIHLKQLLHIEKQEQEKKELQRVHEKEIKRRMHPRTFHDFEILYNELEHWRQYETKRLQNLPLDQLEQRKSLRNNILEKEVKLLQTIDRLKQTAAKDNRDERIMQMLQVMSRPKQWQMSSGDVKLVETPYTIRAKELQELYIGLKSIQKCSIDERLDILLHIKWTIKEFDCQLTRDLVHLIDREADLLNRGRSDQSLKGLRQRISNLFLQFIQTPEFNPEANTFIKVPLEFAANNITY